MKTIFSKKAVPFVVVLGLGISGAFLTTSMQNAKSAPIPKIGYVDGPDGPCTVPVRCNTDLNVVCRASYAPPGQIAKDKFDGDCTEVLYRPRN
jgi:hypothetical protein